MSKRVEPCLKAHTWTPTCTPRQHTEAEIYCKFCDKDEYRETLKPKARVMDSVHEGVGV